MMFERLLAPFWWTWNLPLSQSVFEEMAGLPAWEDHPIAKWSE